MDFDPPPSASGEVAPELFLEGASRDEEATESRDEADSRQETETESRDEVEVEEQAQPKKLRTRGEGALDP